MELDYENIGKRIKKSRKKLKITQAQLAEKVYLSTEYISQIERGVRHLSLDSLANIAEAFDTSVDFLLFGTRSDSVKKIGKESKPFAEYSKNEQAAILEMFPAIITSLHNHNIDV